MPTEISCPSCLRQLRVPDDLLGKTVRCPSCQSTFTATASESPAMPPGPADEGLPPPSPREAWGGPEGPPAGRINVRGEIDRGEAPPPRPVRGGWEDDHGDRPGSRRGRGRDD